MLTTVLPPNGKFIIQNDPSCIELSIFHMESFKIYKNFNILLLLRFPDLYSMMEIFRLLKFNNQYEENKLHSFLLFYKNKSNQLINIK